MNSICYPCTEKKKGCWWIGSFKDLLIHEKTCEYIEIECEYEGCEEKYLRKEQMNHEARCVPLLQYKLKEKDEKYSNLMNLYSNMNLKYSSLENEMNEKNEIISQLTILLNDFKEALIESNEK